MTKEIDRAKELLIEDQAYQTAIAAGILASQHVLRYWPNPYNSLFDKNLMMQIFEKEGNSNYATIADKESEALIIQQIRKNPLLQDQNILAEESNPIESESAYQWVIDPIDGTLRFRNGLDKFGISIGLLKDQQPFLGVLVLPAERRLIAGRKGQGIHTYTFGASGAMQEIPVSNTTSTDLLVGYDVAYEKRAEQITEVARIADSISYPISYGSSVAANAEIVQGMLAAYFHRSPTKFDIAASAFLVAEMGGVVSDTAGKPLDWSKEQIHSYLAARTPQIHAHLLALLQK